MTAVLPALPARSRWELRGLVRIYRVGGGAPARALAALAIGRARWPALDGVTGLGDARPLARRVGLGLGLPVVRARDAEPAAAARDLIAELTAAALAHSDRPRPSGVRLACAAAAAVAGAVAGRLRARGPVRPAGPPTSRTPLTRPESRSNVLPMNTPAPVPFLDLSRQHESVAADVEAAALKVLRSQWFVLGNEGKGLEAEVAQLTGAEHAVGCASGSDALLLALVALGVDRDHAVVTTPQTFFATAGAPARLGARVDFVDVEPDTLNMDVASLRAWLATCTRDADGILREPREGSRSARSWRSTCSAAPATTPASRRSPGSTRSS